MTRLRIKQASSALEDSGTPVFSKLPGARNGRCSAGPSICTKYWSRAKTRDIDRELSTAKSADGRTYLAAGVCGAVGFLGGSVALTPAAGAALAAAAAAACAAGAQAVAEQDLNGMDKAAAAAVPANGCLQVAYPKDGGAGERRWSYTTDSGYCWEK